MDYTRNIDKIKCSSVDPYNGVIGRPVFTNEGSEPLTLQEAKDWGKIDQATDDDIITALITAARKVLESYSGIGFISRSITVGINNSNGGFHLPYGPVTVDPTAVDTDDNTVTLVYNLDQIQEPFGRMVVSYTAGYTSLPEDLKTALKAQILFMIQNRGESAIMLSPVAQMILAPLREVL